MSRVIKHRAWNGGMMLFNGPGGDNDFDITGGVVWIFSSTGYEAVKTDYPLMQYTGLKDKNGVEIWEGDILESPHFKDAAGRGHTLMHIVQWSNELHGWFLLNAGSMDRKDGSLQLFVAEHGEISVIGNIHSNPELLES